MFHFPTFPPHALCVQAWVTGHDSSRVSPFGNPRITAWLPASRGLSQAPTSFIGSWCQGIHRAPLLTWPQRCLFRVHCAVLKVRTVPAPPAAHGARRRRSARAGPVRRRCSDTSRSLRTQQRAWASGARGGPFPLLGSCTWSSARAGRRLVNVPPMSNHPGDTGSRHGSGLADRGRRARRSLERR